MNLHKIAMFAVILLAAPALGADETPVRKPVACSVCETGILYRREGPLKPWQTVASTEMLNSGDLILAFEPGAALLSKNGAVRLAIRGEDNEKSPNPVLETAVVLHASDDVDLDVTLDRGRIDLVNMKEKGPARVRVHVQGKSGELILTEPGARVAVEIYGRWPRGVPFTKKPKPGEGPALSIVVLVLKGEVELKGERKIFVLKAPPGPALLEGNGIKALDPQPTFLEKLPEWAMDGVETERSKKIKELLVRFRKQVLAKGVSAAIAELSESPNPMERRGAVILMGAFDELDQLGKVLATPGHGDAWDAAVLTMRHWIGRGPGQDQILYAGLMAKRGFKPHEAESLLQLLHSFGEEETSRPELYEVLINYLGNEKLAIRGLAHWHLVRLAPAGKKIAFDPLAAKEERDRAILEWKKLIPSGKLPPEDK